MTEEKKPKKLSLKQTILGLFLIIILFLAGYASLFAVITSQPTTEERISKAIPNFSIWFDFKDLNYSQNKQFIEFYAEIMNFSYVIEKANNSASLFSFIFRKQTNVTFIIDVEIPDIIIYSFVLASITLTQFNEKITYNYDLSYQFSSPNIFLITAKLALKFVLLED